MAEMDLDIVVDLDSLKIREIEEIEEATGMTIDEAFANGKPRGRALRAVAWVVRRRTDPDFTFEEAGELTISLSSVGPDPTSAAAS